MSFAVRQIARRADGGYIIRTRVFDQSELTVGRGTDCDIQLADLGVMLRHLRLLQLAGGKLAVEATGGVPVEIGGSFVTRADLDVAAAPVINIASHRLSISPGDTPDSIAITAERVIAASDAEDQGGETGIFSLRGAMPSKRTLSWLLAGLILATCLILPWWLIGSASTDLPPDMVAAAARPPAGQATLQPVGAPPAIPARGGTAPDEIWSSGPLSAAHAGLSNNCGACHQKAFQSVTDASCIACHKPDTTPAHAAAGRMTRGALVKTGLIADLHKGMNLPEGRCASCHKEHEGPQGALLVATSFCTDCHAGLSGRLPDTRLGNVPDWPRHPQFKPTLVAAPSLTAPRFERVSLAARPRENSGLVYPHDIHQSATNSVANMVRKQGLPGQNGALACSYCHTPDSDGVRFKPIEMEKNCGACHDLAFARDGGPDGGIVRTLPHGKPEQVAGIVRDFYLAEAISPRPGVQRLAFERRQPGQMAEYEAAGLAVRSAGAARARADQTITAIFSKNGVCADCHAITDTGAPNIAQRYAIGAVTLADHYLPKGRFPHNQHEVFGRKTGDAACLSCHQGALTSKTAADLLLPDVASCRQCHGSPKVATNVAAECSTCHGFHYGEDGHGGDFGVVRRRAVVAPVRTAETGRRGPGFGG